MKISLCAISLLLLTLFTVRFASANDEKRDEPATKIVYNPRVPAGIARLVTKSGRMRFFGTFKRGSGAYAVYLYDQTVVVDKAAKNWIHDVRLDAFQRTPNAWKKIQSHSFMLRTPAREENRVVGAESAWLDPARATVPLIHLTLMEKDSDSGNSLGSHDDIYGVLGQTQNPGGFIALEAYNPEFITTPSTYNFIAAPDARGNVTLIHGVSRIDSGSDYQAYGWDGKSWKELAKAHYPNGEQANEVWDGTAFKVIPDIEPAVN